MYIACHKIKSKWNYTLKSSCTIGDELQSITIFDLGQDPSIFIKYTGTNGFYFDERIEQAIIDSGLKPDSDEIEDLLWPWINNDIRYAVETFKHRSSKTGFKRMTSDQKKQIRNQVHWFDKRRAHFLKFGSMAQGSVEKMPPVLFKQLPGCCRDEIEQSFLQQELRLKPHELKSYVYTAFDLQRFFNSFMAKKMPHVLDQKKVETFFHQELCQLNEELFNLTSHPHEYMIRYIIMFYDYLYTDSTLLDDFAKAFMDRRRVFKTKPKNPVPIQKALTLFNITGVQLKTLTKEKLTRMYRKLARTVHPDTGGSEEKFVELNDAFNQLLDNIKAR